MPSTTNRGYSVPATGTEVDLWGQNDLNPNFAAIDTNIGGVLSISTTGGDTTLNSTQYANGTISVSGTLTSNARIIFPAVQGWWTVENLTTGNFILQFVAGSATEVIATSQGSLTDIQINGNVVKFRNLPPVGTYLDVATDTVPSWIGGCTKTPYLNCDGSVFSAVSYPYLNTFLGGNTLPYAKGVVLATLNQGSGNITSAGSGIDGNTKFATGGTQTKTLTLAQLPAGITSNTTGAINVSVVSTGSNIDLGIGISNVGAGGNSINTVSSQGSITSTGSIASGAIPVTSTNTTGSAHSIMPPTLIFGLRLIRAA